MSRLLFVTIMLTGLLLVSSCSGQLPTDSTTDQPELAASLLALEA